MATFQQLMRAAENAESQGDTDAARQLVGMAHRLMTQSNQGGGRVDAPIGDRVELQIPTAESYDPNKKSDPKPNRFGDTYAKAVEGPVAATKHYFAEARNPENSIGERALDAGKALLSGAGSVYAAGAGLAGDVTGLLGATPTRERKLARDLMMMGEVAAPELAGVSSASRLAGASARQAQKLEKPATDKQLAARAADDLDIVPSLGAGGKVRAQTAATLEKVPGVSGVIERDTTRFVDDVERAFVSVRQGIGEAKDALGAGEALQGGVGKFVDRFEKTSRRLYDNVGKVIPADTKVQAPNTVRAIQEALEPFADNPQIRKELGLDRWANLAADLETGLSWKALSDLRSSVGKSIGKISGPMADMDQGRLKQVYGQLTADMEAAAAAAGPRAKAAWDRANKHYKAGAERIQGALDKTIKANSPERAFEAFAAMSKVDRASSDIRRMRLIKKSMPAEDWESVSASIVDRLGKARPGQQGAMGDTFSPGTFLTEWNKISNEAKAILVKPSARVQLDKLARVAESAKRAASERNHSNTGTIVGGAMTGSGLMAAPVTTASVLAAANIGARAMTSERMLRAMNNMARGDDRLMRSLAREGSPFMQDAQTILRLAAADAASVLPAANTDQQPAIALP